MPTYQASCISLAVLTRSVHTLSSLDTVCLTGLTLIYPFLAEITEEIVRGHLQCHVESTSCLDSFQFVAWRAALALLPDELLVVDKGQVLPCSL